MSCNAARHGASVDTALLREQAQQCVRLARDWPDVPISYQLEAIGLELMLKAAEIDELLADWVTTK